MQAGRAAACFFVLRCYTHLGTGTYITPTMQGSRNGVGMAIAWATMVSTGEDGYRKMARDVHNVHSRMKEAVSLIQGIELVCDADLCIVPITSPTLDVKALASAMGKRGWSLFASADPQPRGSIEVCVGAQHVQLIDQVRLYIYRYIAFTKLWGKRSHLALSVAGTLCQ